MSHTEDKNLDPASNLDPRSSNLGPGVKPRSSSLGPQTSNPEPDEINLLELLLVLAKHWKMIVGVPLVAAVITAIITLCMPNIYTAKAMILPTDDDSGGMMAAMMAQMGGLASLAGGLVGGTSKADQYVAMLKSETIKDPIIDRFKLMEVYEEEYREGVYKNLDTLVEVTTGKKDGVITIAVDDKDPKRAAEMANTYVDELGKLTARLNMTGAGQNRVFLESRLSKAKVDLAVAEDTLKSFQTRNMAVAVTDQAKATLEGVALLRAQMVAQEVQLATLRQIFTDNSQEVKSTKATIANLRGQIAKFEGSGSEGSMPGVGAMPQLGQEYIRLMREFKIQETLVELLTKQSEITKLNEVKDVVPFQVLQSAKVPDIKSKPKRAQIIIMTVLATGFLMVLVAFIQGFVERMAPEDRQRWDQIRVMLPSLPKPLARVWERLNTPKV